MTLIAASAGVWIFILVPLILIWSLALVDIFRRDLPRSTKAVWAIIVLLLPVIGTVAYFLMRKPTESEIRRAREAAVDGSHGLPRVHEPRPPLD